VYREPDHLDIIRDDPPARLTFGDGAHHCLGAHLARIELTEALRIITLRMPNPRRTQSAPWKAVTGIFGPISVPWG
jgi:cytochrome P450